MLLSYIFISLVPMNQRAIMSEAQDGSSLASHEPTGTPTLFREISPSQQDCNCQFFFINYSKSIVCLFNSFINTAVSCFRTKLIIYPTPPPLKYIKQEKSMLSCTVLLNILSFLPCFRKFYIFD